MVFYKNIYTKMLPLKFCIPNIMNKKIFLYCFMLVLSKSITAQKIITVDDAVSMALQNNKNTTAAILGITKQKQLLKGSYNLPNPEVFLESPTGNFYTTSILQSFEFPSVYTKQYQLQKEKITYAEKEKNITTNDVKYQVVLLYLKLQYAKAISDQLQIQDTAFYNITKAAGRQFDAGQIDYLQKIFTENQYGEVHNQYTQILLNIKNIENQFQYFTGIKEKFSITPFDKNNIAFANTEIDTAKLSTNATVQLLQQDIIIAEKNVALQKSKALPGFAFGYFNQGEKSTVFQNRFRFGIRLPLWAGQYKSSISAAKTDVEISKQKSNGLTQQLTLQMLQANNDNLLAQQSLLYYENTGLKKANEILNTARRFFESGENDYINYLRTINDAYAIQLKYIEAINNYKISIINSNYLKGTL